MKLGELTNLYCEAKDKLEATKTPKKQKAVEGIPLSHELVRDGGIIAFLMGALFLLIAIVPPPLHPAYDMTKPPTFVKPDWYLLWSLGPIFLAKWPIAIGGVTLIDTKFLGTLLVQVPFIGVAIVPFVAKGKAQRPIESPSTFGWAMFGIAGIWWLSLVGIADIIFAYETKPLHGYLHWMLEAGKIIDPSALIDAMGILTLHQSLLFGFLGYWFIKRHRPRYESKLNATYYKVR